VYNLLEHVRSNGLRTLEVSVKEQEEREERDDLNVEITDLDETESPGSTPVSACLVARTHFFARRHKRPLAIVTVAMLLLAILLVLISTSSVRGLSARLFTRATPAPIATLYPGVDYFYVQADPPWGQLTIDGHTIVSLPVTGTDAPLRLSRGRHTLVWSAAPFQPQRCSLSVPTNYLADTCADRSTMEVGPDIFATIVSFTNSLTTLPVNQRAALISAVQAVLSKRQSVTVVQTGELYALTPSYSSCKPAPGEPLCYAVAGQPLSATLRFELDTSGLPNETCSGPETGCTFMYQSCYAFCPLDAGVPGAADTWDVLAPVLPLWTFQTLDGQALEQNVPDNSLWDFATKETADESLVEIRLAWRNQAWQVAIPVNMSGTSSIALNPICATANNIVELQEPPVDSSGNPLNLQWQYGSGNVPAAGCVGAGGLEQNSVLPSTLAQSSPAVAYVLQRFGVLLAANAQTHRLFPYLPLADAYEQQLTQQLAKNING